jgi:hypothetical protein
MLNIPREELHLVTAAGTMSDMAPAIPIAVSIGAAIGTSSSITAAGGLSALSTLGAGPAGIALGGLASSFIVGATVGNWIGETECVRNMLSGWMSAAFDDE